MALVSLYDVMISDLIHVLGKDKPSRILSPEKDIKFKDVCNFKELSELTDFYVEQVIERVLFESRLNQVNWLLEKAGQKLDSKHWPIVNDRTLLNSIIEIGERRNLYTHTGGLVSKKYLKVLKEHGIETSLSLNEMAPILPEYYKKSVSTLLEFGIKLINTVWRNTSDCTDEADIEISQIVYKLIVLRRYKLAARLASFALDITGKKRVQKDRHRKMLTVNLANAYALSKDKQKSEQALAREDWTSASDDFRLCVEAVKANAIAVSRIMKRIGRDGDIRKEDYAEWPVFEQVRDTDIFKETFRDIFGEDFKPYQAPEFDHERASEFINRKKLEKEASSAEEAGTVH